MAASFTDAVRHEAAAASLELKLALLASALNSGRPSSLVLPFPPIEDDEPCSADTPPGVTSIGGVERDYDSLRECLRGLPPVGGMTSERYRSVPRNAQTAAARSKEARLLQWLVSDLSPGTVPVPVEAAYRTLSNKAPPTHQFAVEHTEASNASWAALVGQYGAATVYHGSAVENFHAITHGGLRNFSGTLGERTGAAFGSGIYLSDSLELCMGFAPVQSARSQTWEHASFGQSLSCVAICEVCLHPSVRRPACAAGGEGLRTAHSGCGDVPEKYWVVPDSRYVRVVGLLLTGDRERATGAQRQQQLQAHRSEVMMSDEAVARSKATSASSSMIVMYALLLLILAIGQSSYCRRLWKNTRRTTWEELRDLAGDFTSGWT